MHSYLVRVIGSCVVNGDTKTEPETLSQKHENDSAVHYS